MSKSQKLIPASALNEFNSNDLEKEGSAIYKKNKHMQEIANFMEHPLFYTLYKKYFNSWSDIKTLVMFLKIYEKISQRFPIYNGYQKIAILKKLINNSKIRAIICYEMSKWASDQLN